MICPHCNEEALPGATICRLCGAGLPGGADMCAACGGELPEGASFCPACGQRTQLPATGATIRLAMPPPQRCPRCQGAMERGFVADAAWTRRAAQAWFPEDLTRSRPGRRARLASQALRALSGHRCADCGYVELYAIDLLDEV